jgi:hypothetical protein
MNRSRRSHEGAKPASRKSPGAVTYGSLLAASSVVLIGACGGGGNSSTPAADGGGSVDSGGQGLVDSTTPQLDSATSLEAAAEASAPVDTGPPPPTGDAGEACTPPDQACGPGLYCNGGICAVSYCSGKPLGALPYNIANDFGTVFTIGPEKDNFTVIPSGADCDSTTYPPLPNTGLGDGGTDGGDAGFPTLDDGGVEIVTFPTPQPSCYEFLYDPSCETGAQGLCWAGAVFTNSPATAAAAPGAVVTTSAVGACVAPGATTISFWAKASLDGAIVKFGSSRPGACLVTPILEADGGIPDPAAERAVCPSDTEFYLRLSTEWQNYWLNLPAGEPYNDEPGAGGGVWNAFSVVVEPEDIIGGSYIFVKDIVWSNPADGYDGGVGTDSGPDGAADAGADGATDAGVSDATPE